MDFCYLRLSLLSAFICVKNLSFFSKCGLDAANQTTDWLRDVVQCEEHCALRVRDGAAGDGGGAGQHQHAAGGDAGAGHFAGDVLQQATR